VRTHYLPISTILSEKESCQTHKSIFNLTHVFVSKQLRTRNKNVKSPYILSKIQVCFESILNINRSVLFHTTQKQSTSLNETVWGDSDLCDHRRVYEVNLPATSLILICQNQSHNSWNNSIKIGDHKSQNSSAEVHRF
jgi:hypothetical protein